MSTPVRMHEVCHAAAPASDPHGTEWLGLMRQSAQRAEALGQDELARRLRDEAAAYEDPKRSETVTAEGVYQRARDIAWAGGSLLAAQCVLADEQDMTEQEFLEAYPDFQREFEAAQRLAGHGDVIHLTHEPRDQGRAGR